ncbi:6823_t:CDS:2 [Entrophospora sp. SA101]|nr:6823_t:CDS:2 [Entrophospora sp. SA101]CAJ0827601.1 2740_t:CDS:2 [Entrophospora sp. SA101]
MTLRLIQIIICDLFLIPLASTLHQCGLRDGPSQKVEDIIDLNVLGISELSSHKLLTHMMLALKSETILKALTD